jgi:hypothetical protein
MTARTNSELHVSGRRGLRADAHTSFAALEGAAGAVWLNPVAKASLLARSV